MKFLLDTHAFLWYVWGDERLSPKALELIDDEENQLFVSFASLWEVSIKNSSGKLELLAPFERFVDYAFDENDFYKLGISTAHVKAVNSLEVIHKDPFDRMIIAQSMTEGIPVISKDEHFESYPIEVIW